MAVVEYPHGSKFPGRIGLTTSESSPAWPEPIRARDGSPNILFFVLDDVGYGQLSTFGGLVETPNIDRVAERGLRHANMHTTALCSPTRSCILTGRNHHSNGVASIMETATGYPGYDARMPFENGMLPEILRQEGYNTFCVGKWHLSPAEENTAAGPMHRWPLGRGFDAQCEMGLRHGHSDTELWVETMRELASRTGMRELTVRALLHGAALGHEGDAPAAALLAADVDNPSLHVLLGA